MKIPVEKPQKCWKPYLVYLGVFYVIVAVLSFIVFDSGGRLIENFERWSFVQFWQTALLLIPVCFLSVYCAEKFGRLSVIGLGTLTALVHVLLSSYNMWLLSGLTIPRAGVEEMLVNVVENNYWPYPVWNFLRDIIVPVLSLILIRRLTSHSSGMPDGTP